MHFYYAHKLQNNDEADILQREYNVKTGGNLTVWPMLVFIDSEGGVIDWSVNYPATKNKMAEVFDYGLPGWWSCST